MAKGYPIIRECEVLSIDDPFEADRIKVRLMPEDETIIDIESLPYVIPLMPKMFRVKPKLHETVLILTATINNNTNASQRFYLGPVISQLNRINEDNYFGTSMAFLNGFANKIPQAPSKGDKYHKYGEIKGVYFDDDDIGVLGRGKCDIQIKENDLRLRCGVKKETENLNNFYFNTVDPCYLKLKYHEGGLGEIYHCGSSATIVADKINLIGNNNTLGIKVNDRTDLITNDEMKKILDKAHELPYGDLLIEFLDMFRKAFLNHTHPFAMKEPIVDDNVQPVANYELNKLISDDVRIS